MGGAVKLTLYAPSENTAEAAAKAAYGRFAELEQIMSDYRPSSEISQLAAKAILKPTPVSHDLWRVIQRCQDVFRHSAGAFDATCGPIVALWREARQTGKRPDSVRLEVARAKTGWNNVLLDRKARTVSFRLRDMKIDLGGIAKGDACDQAMQVLKQHGIRSAMVEAGGDLKVSDPPPGMNGWTIAIRGLPDRWILRNKAISTSGDTEQFVVIDGVRYSHIVDPRTGLGVTNRVQATVIADSGLTTDPLATAVCVLGERRSRAMLRTFRAKAILTIVKN